MKALRHTAVLFAPLLLGATLHAATPQPTRADGEGKSAAPSGERKVKYYKSTMAPGEVKPGPGKDSMGMDMVPVYEGEDTSADSNIQIDAATTQRMNLKTALVERGPVYREFRTVGTVAYNESGLRDITTKYEGWIEKLFVNTTWTSVKTGDPLFAIYSPDLYNAQLNYVVALRAEGEPGGPLSRAALARLQLFDVPADFIAELKRSGEAQRTMIFRAPADGVVIEKMAVQGQMMKPGERIYRIADLSTVWVHAQIYEKDLPFVAPDQEAVVRTSYGPERRFTGTVQLLVPQVSDQTRTATARIVLPNPDLFLRPGMFVDVGFEKRLADDAVLVPDMAVLRSGERTKAFVALEGGFFEPRDVTLGQRSQGNFYEVLGGLNVGERVVTSGQFMLDSESQLREAIQKMLKGAPAAESTPQGGTAPASHENTPGMKMPEPSAPDGAPPKGHNHGAMEHKDHTGAKGPDGSETAAAARDPSNASGGSTVLRLPPGHPPIDSVSTVDYLRLQSDGKKRAAAEDACGGCGMSQAAMAAGEPCEHAKN